MKNINAKLSLLTVFISLVGCATATDDRLYRPNTFNNNAELCGKAEQPIGIDATKTTEKFIENELTEVPSNTLLCSLQAYNRGHAVAYDLAFVEMLDSGNIEGTNVQTDALYQYIDLQLKKDEDLWVYVFVHGWRHNANIGDEDVAKFHTMLALSKNHLNQKNSKAKVLGVYVGWRGMSVSEPAPLSKIPKSVPAIFSFLSRKTQSDHHAATLQAFLEALDTKLKSASSKTTKLITIGHSLGGNMLLRAVTPMLKNTINPTGTTAGTPTGKVVKGFGDLVVLLNPASELANWQELQNASRVHAGISDTTKNSYLNASECQQLSANITEAERQKCQQFGTHHVYPAGQLPVVVSFTSSKHFDILKYSDEELIEKAKNKENPRGATDSATSTFFPLAQRAMNWFGAEADIKALGQMLPRRAWNNEGKPDQEAYGNLMYGLSHEMEIDSAAKLKTTYHNALKTGAINCTADRTILTSEIENYIKLSENTGGRGWDHSKLVVGKTTAADGMHGIEINVKHGVLRTKCSARSKAEIPECDIGNSHQVPRLGHAREPYWNVAAHQNLIDGHGGYVSAALLCFVNGLVIP